MHASIIYTYMSVFCCPPMLQCAYMDARAVKHFKIKCRRSCIRRNTRGQSAHPKIPLEKFSPSGGVPSGILPSRGILKNIILCRHKTFNPPEGLIPCMPCRGKTYKIPLAFFSISTPAGFNLVENSGGKT